MSVLKQITLFCFLLYGILFSQSPLTINYCKKFNIPTYDFYGGIKSKNGHYYFGTDKGALFFDGNEFTFIKSQKGNVKTDVFDIVEDSLGTIWLLTYRGELWYKKQKEEKFQKFDLPEISGYLSASYVYDKGIYVGTSFGKVYKIENHEIQNRWDVKQHIIKFYKSNTTHFNIVTLQSIFSISDGKIEIKKALVNENKNKRAHAHHGNLFIGSGSQINVYNEFKLIGQFTLESAPLIQAITTNKENLIVSTNIGVYLVNLKDFSTKNIIFKGADVTNVIFEKEGDYWVTTKNEGLLYINNPDIIEEKEVPVVSLLSKGDSLFIGSNYNKFYILTNNTSEVHSINSSPKTDVNNIKNINGVLYFISKTGVSILDKSKWENLHFGCNDLALLDKETFLICMNKSFLIKKKDIKKKIQRDIIQHLKVPPVVRISYFNNDYIIGSINGLYSYSGSKIEELKSINYESLGYVSDILVANKKLYVATLDNGFFELSISDEGYKLENKLKRQGITAITYHENKVWLVQDNGLYVYSPEKEILTLFFQVPREYGWISDLCFVKNKLFFGTDKGLFSFNSSSKTLISRPPTLKLKSFIVNGELAESLNGLTYKQNNIQINVKAISSGYHNLTYYYKLNDKDYWSLTEAPSLSFPSLMSGQYDLKIYAQNSNGEKSNVLSLPIFIKKPYWEEWWFYLVLFITIIVVVTTIIKIRFKIQAQKHFLKEQVLLKEKEKVQLAYSLSAAENKALRMQMNPHFIFNALNNIKGLYAKNDSIQANQYLITFSKLLRNVLESESEKIAITKEIEILQSYMDLAMVRQKNKFEYRVNISPEIDKEKQAIPPMLIQPFIENTLVHGISKIKNGIIDLTLKNESNLLVIKIEDNGVGRDNAKTIKNHKSLSTRLTKKRILLLGEKYESKTVFEIIDKPNKEGTVVLIKIPILYVD